MNPDDSKSRPEKSNPSDDDREPARPEENQQVVTTVDRDVANGLGRSVARNVRPDETMVTETSKVTRPVPSYLSDSNAILELDSHGHSAPGQADPRKASGEKADHSSRGRDDSDRGQHDPSVNPDSQTHQGGSGWLSYLITGVVALVCGLGGAWAFVHFESTKKDDPSKEESKSKGDSASKKEDSSKDQAKAKGGDGGSASDSGSEIPGFTSADDADTLKKQIQSLSSRIDTLQQRIESLSMPHETASPDVGTLRIKVGELSRSVDEVSSLPSRSREMENKLDQLQEEVRGLKNQISIDRERGGIGASVPTLGVVDRKVDSLVGSPPAPPDSILPNDPNSPDPAMAVGIALFKKGQYPQADDIFRKLQLTRPQDARVWYYSALARGFTGGEWEGDPKRLVTQGADRERAGMPSTERIDAAFIDLDKAQGKDWLAAYRAKLVK